MDPAPDGFFIDMSGNRGLVINRDPRKQTVKSMGWYENLGGRALDRKYHEVDSFDLPPTGPEPSFSKKVPNPLE